MGLVSMARWGCLTIISRCTLVYLTHLCAGWSTAILTAVEKRAPASRGWI